MDILSQIDRSKLPHHIAVIMDGNGRWAKGQGGIRIFGHRSAIKAVRETTEGAAELGVGFLTLYAFSTENWNRPKAEVEALMTLLVDTIHGETPTLQKNNIRLNAIGNLEALPTNCLNTLTNCMQATANNTGMLLTLALSYGSRSDITLAVKKIAEQVQKGELLPENIDDKTIKSALSTHNIPDPELLIRTSGEQRISNFLLWEIAYTELYITPKLWPDFRREDLIAAILDFQKRERRFGKTGEQLVGS